MMETSEIQPWPDLPDAISIAAMLWLTLKGTMNIGGDGRRYRGQPELCSAESLPKLPGSQPWETFLNVDEYRGAMKLLDYILSRASEADRALVFTTFASMALDTGKSFDFRDAMH